MDISQIMYIYFVNIQYILGLLQYLQNCAVTMLLTGLSRILLMMLSVHFTRQLEEVMTQQIMIPLAYAYSTSSKTQKFPIILSFSQSNTITPFPTQQLLLYNQNVSMQTQYVPGIQHIIIGLKSPSTFIYAIKSLYGVQGSQIQFGMNPFTKLLINYNNYVQSTDSFINGAIYDVQVKYNFGGSLRKQGQICQLQDSDIVKLDELLILQILNQMSKRNKISFEQHSLSETIELFGEIENFPLITLQKDNSLFQLTITGTTINYLPHSSNTTESRNIIGLKSLKSFSKFSIDENSDVIMFKRTSQLFQLYLFLGYFFIFVLITIAIFHSNLQDSMNFIKNVINWIITKDNQARVRVLRTQLQ